MPFLKRKQKVAFEGGGLVLFTEVHEAMRAEKVLNKGSYEVRLVAPPPELRKGCDLAVEVNLMEQPGIERLLKGKNVDYVEVTPLITNTCQLLEVVRVTDFGEWLMVKAGNMKLSYDKKTGIIVNISGGGCPDIPYLHAELLGKLLGEAPKPRDLGFTLCALMLDRALEEGVALWDGGR